MFPKLVLGLSLAAFSVGLCQANSAPERASNPDSATTTAVTAPISRSESRSGISHVTSLLGGLRKVGGYVANVSRDVTNISAQEVAVSRQYRCLAQAVYFEGRGEPTIGQQAIAHVILNRVRDSRYPSTICGVVYQNQNLPNRCQFSFACDGKSEKAYDSAAWQQSLRIAFEALAGISPDVSNSSTHFHATHVEPLWAMTLKPTVKLGQHVFYQDPRRSEYSISLMDLPEQLTVQ